MSEALKRLAEFADSKPKIGRLLALILRIIVNEESGPMEVNFSQGGVTAAYFKKKEV